MRMGTKTKENRPVFEGKCGNVRVPVYKREQIKQGKTYATYSVADYSSGKRKLWGFADPAKAKDKANEIAAAITTGHIETVYWGDTLKSEITRALEISRSVEIDLLPGVQLLASAIRILGNADNILVACQHWQKNRPDKPFTPKSVIASITEYLSKQTKISARRKRTITSLTGTFASRFGGLMLHEVSTPDLKDFADSKDWAPKSYNDFLGAVSLVFIEGQLRGWLPAGHNPTKLVKRLKVKGSAIGIFQPWEAKQILARIDVELRPFLAIWLFSGCRKEEASRLSWQQLNRALETGFIELEPGQTKTGNPRSVSVESNLKLWLLAYRKDCGSVMPVRWQGMQRLDDLSKYISRKTGVVWQNNGARHSFASYLFKRDKDPGAVVDAMGTSLAKFEKHYRSREKTITEKSAGEWFSIAPGAEQNVVKLSAAVAA